MYQRSSTFVVSVEPIAAMLGAVYNDDFPTELADTYTTSQLPTSTSGQLIRMGKSSASPQAPWSKEPCTSPSSKITSPMVQRNTHTSPLFLGHGH
ncbi:hypothetical protein BDR04DRAFT_37520 [Suillus decipiens]|nr:hypothetical protein BDR04DRAFT_37520 [Suillus decipiens]